MQNDLSVTTIGTTTGRYRPRAFGIRQADRLMHMYIVGQTGTGKSTLLLNMMKQDAKMNRGFCLVDPHGDLAEQVSAIAGADQIYWNVADPQCPYGYNPLTHVSAEYRPPIASGLIDALKKQWSDAWGVRMEHLLRFSLLALLEQPKASIQDIMPMFLDKNFRQRVVATITDPHVRAFWAVEFPNMNYKGAVDGVAPIANKLGGFLSHPLVRRMMCEPEQPLRFRQIMDEGGQLIVNLSKGKIGADIANILGGMILSSIANAAYSRQNLSEIDRRPFFVFADEFHSFTTSAFSGMLSELRKYGLGLVLAHQHTDQLDRATLEAILGNVGTVMSFRVGATDAPILAHQLGAVLPRDLIGMANYELFIKLMIEGVQSKVFSASTRCTHSNSDRLKTVGIT
ncbi:MAG: type IV secretion system DNA-binding domain-containing protein [Rhodobacteraceae bacterium]|nr:type IV secretion system DNA-binding domain-containing protein [Paracoccaceae bacterium]